MNTPLIGKKFGTLTIQSVADRCCICLCECGSTTVKWTSNVTTGKTASCGCARGALISAAITIHGETDSPEYKSWSGMIDRCCNAKHKRFALWGGRGISVCDSWRHSFEAFLADMGRKPSSGHSIDRYPNNDGNYEPGNCRWATAKEQSTNRRGLRLLEICGETLTASDWAKRKGIDVRLVLERINRGWSSFDAVNKPPETSQDRRVRVSQQATGMWSPGGVLRGIR